VIDRSAATNNSVIEAFQRYDARDAILYALGLGLGRNPTDRIDLPYLNEQRLRVLPTMAAAMAFVSVKGFNLGLDLTRALHGEQRLTIHRPLPTSGAIVGRARVSDVIDLGREKGALVMVERVLSEADSGTLLATASMTIFCRADGGFGGAPRQRSAGHPLPSREPDRVVEVPTSPRSGLIYRLSGDYNQVHIDPDVARSSGFERPILHGLATYGIIGWAVFKHLFNGNADILREFDGRFSAPVYPGDTLRIEMWQDGPLVSTRAASMEQQALVFDHGRMLVQ
jgi:acyl dehydratase